MRRLLTQDEFTALLDELRLRQSEFEDIEAKAAQRGTPERIYETLSSFANRTGGGTILFGIDDESREPVGVGNPDQLQRDVAAKASEMEPPVRVQIQPFVIGGKVVVVAQVPETEPQLKPCYYRPAGLSAGAFIRVGDGDRRMTEYEIYTYLSSRGQVLDDRSAVLGATLEDLDADLIAQYVAKLRAEKPGARYLHRPQSQLLRTLGILASDQDRDIPTLAGLLTFGTYPQQFYPGLVITLTATSDASRPSGERFADNLKAEGTILEMLKQAMAWLQRNLRTRTLVTGLIHQDIPEYPLEALREAIVNAVVHRDYSRYVLGTQVQVRLFPDRIEVQNPGGLYGAVTVDRLGEPGMQSARNQYLAKLLEDLGPMENRGSGIQTMLQAMRQAHLAPPRFDDNRTFFRVTFSNHTLLTDEVIAWLGQFAHVPQLNDRQRYALAFLKEKGKMVNRDYQLLNNVDARTASRELRGLVETSIVETVGTRGGAYYQLAPKVPKVSPWLSNDVTQKPQPVPEKYRPVFELVQVRGPISASDIADALGVSRRGVNYILGKLAELNLIKATASSPRSRNQAYTTKDL